MIKGRTGAPVALAKSEKRAARFAREYDRVMAGQAGPKTRKRVLDRIQDAGAQEVAKSAGNPQCDRCGRFAKTKSAKFCSKCGTAMAKRNFRGEVGGGVDVDKLKPSDFVFGDERAFPAVKPGDVPDAVSPWGRYKGGKSFDEFKAKLTALAHRKGASFVDELPKEWTKGGAAKSAGIPELEQVHLSRLVAKAQNGADSNERAEAIGELMAKVGREVAAQLVGGDLLSPSQFTRAYLSQHRAPLSAPAGQTPRIPEVRPISSDDFRRPALTANHQRPNPLDRLMDPGQVAAYRPGGGIPEGSPYQGAPSGTTIWPALAATRSAFARAPQPGDARG